jgi:DNA polymerase-3 subunit epsilon
MTSSAQAQAQEWLSAAPLILDTETTGLDDQAEILEIAIINAQGETVFYSRIKPVAESWPEAEKIHGISAIDLAASPTYPDIHEQIYSIINNRLVLIYNSDYDKRIINQVCARHRLTAPRPSAFGCVMKAYSSHLGVEKWQRLTAAAAQTSYPASNAPHAHSAVGDCLMTLHVLRHIAQNAV